jgi:exosortase
VRQWDWNRLLTPRIVFMMLPIVGLLGVAYAYPLIRWELIWRNEDAWSHGYLIPLLAVMVAHFRLKERPPARIQPCIWGLGLIVGGFVLRIWSRTMMFGYPGQVTFLAVVAGIILLVLGWEVFKAVWVSVVYLGLMIPWSSKYYEGIALPLQGAAAWGAEHILSLLGFILARDGNVLILSSGRIAVAEACSGLRLLMAFVALGVLMAFMYRRAWWERAVIIGSSVPIAVFCNVIRVTLMGVSSEWLHAEADRLAQGAATWSAYAPQFTAWSGLAWVGLVALVGGVFLLVMRGGEERLARFATPRRAAGLAVAGAVLIALTSGLRIGYETPAQLEEIRQVILNPKSGPHQAFGFAMLGLAFALMWLELRFIDLFFVDEPDSTETDAPGDTGRAAGETGTARAPEA